MTTATSNPVPRCITSAPFTNSIGVMILRRVAPELADDVERRCEQVNAEIDLACGRVRAAVWGSTPALPMN